MSAWLSALWSLGLILLVSQSAAAEPARSVYVIAVGNNLPPPDHAELSRLRYADDDALRFFELLASEAPRRALLATVDADTKRRYGATSALAESPTYATLKRTLERYRAEMQRDRSQGRAPVLFLTFSGHGVSDAQGEPALALLDQPLTRSRLHQELLPLLEDASVHLIIDACRADGVVGARGAFDVELEGTTTPLTGGEAADWLSSRSLARFPNVGALVASARDQETHEWSQLEAGVFSHELLSALRGAADANGDLKLAYSEVRAFVAAANRDARDPRARPALIAHLPQQGDDALLLDLRELRNVRLLHGDAESLGHFFVELDNGERLLDAHLAAGYRVALAVPTQHDLFVHAERGEAAVARERGHVALEDLVFHQAALSARGSVEHSLRETLWKTAYGPVYYRGFVDSAGLQGVTFGEPSQLPKRDAPPARAGSRRKLAIALGAIAGAAAVACVASAWLTVSARKDFDATDQEKRAHELHDAYERRLAASLATAGTALAFGGTAVAVWPWFAHADGKAAGAGVATRVQF